jgi:hypothetical protein
VRSVPPHHGFGSLHVKLCDAMFSRAAGASPGACEGALRRHGRRPFFRAARGVTVGEAKVTAPRAQYRGGGGVRRRALAFGAGSSLRKSRCRWARRRNAVRRASGGRVTCLRIPRSRISVGPVRCGRRPSAPQDRGRARHRRRRRCSKRTWHVRVRGRTSRRLARRREASHPDGTSQHATASGQGTGGPLGARPPSTRADGAGTVTGVRLMRLERRARSIPRRVGT